MSIKNPRKTMPWMEFCDLIDVSYGAVQAWMLADEVKTNRRPTERTVARILRTLGIEKTP